MSPCVSRVSRRLILATLLSALSIPGCGVSWASPRRTRLWGRVTYNGKPVEGGAIVFMPAVGEKADWAAGRITEGGNFSISESPTDDRLQAGRYEIFFTRPAPITLEGKSTTDATTDQAPAQVAKEQAAHTTSANRLPERFMSAKTSGLEFVFDGQPQRVDLDLTEKD